MPAKNDKSLTPVRAGDEAEYPVLALGAETEIRELYQAAAGAGLDPSILQRDKCGAGGALEFRIPRPEGEEATRTAKGLVVNIRQGRVLWKDEGKPSRKRPPDCVSNDGFIGVGNPGGECVRCPYSQFGSSTKGHGQACKQIHQMLILHPGEIIPHILTVPPTSIKNCGKYFLMLLSRKIPYWSVITRIDLERATNEDGIDYAKMTFSVERYLTDEERAAFAPIQKEMKSLLDPVAIDSIDYQVESDL
jgi:hypothetical protein